MIQNLSCGHSADYKIKAHIGDVVFCLLCDRQVKVIRPCTRRGCDNAAAHRIRPPRGARVWYACDDHLDIMTDALHAGEGALEEMQVTRI